MRKVFEVRKLLAAEKQSNELQLKNLKYNNKIR